MDKQELLARLDELWERFKTLPLKVELYIVLAIGFVLGRCVG
jgi:hypothetical protein